ncbi:hypothetical protein CH298_02520 [Rhodococcoides fascians]|uniref:helix-turn-helix domain-containing protein n=1 Tax=Rhodococcoides fascians TaxID=1828 RepID=UPI000B9BA7AF|nr:helix-turn-helix domain-containing protein [Rhodococcus fascians]OZE92429.1 hypothetical protein CH303_02520 [Rhodococcus fascians]OZF23062.1 hypothetical protein CH298_02520 [Rhodococcus fascians]OZF24776.1 hypothetical protein CH297_02520 [Rhodococcus fascians]OZF72371.1 hypothetical protein CH308_02525 [Rhodococcus fascians]OZF73669.1 hypothetical protein CH307_02520 [Rhodococcus fascians]
MTLTSDRIALSWQRASMSGLDPALLPREIDIITVPDRGRLAIAARPVLDRLAVIFADTDFSVILADRNVRLVDVRHGTPGIDDALTNNGAVLGRLFTEETAGTNSISTVRELREPLAVKGNQHFFEAMKMFSCYGFPILHPVTGRIEGVITLTFYTESDTPVLHGLVMQAAQEISTRLAQDPVRSDHQLLDAFHLAAGPRIAIPIVAMAPGIVIANTAAASLLNATDYISLAARDPQVTERDMHLFGTGEQVDVSVHALATDPQSMIVEFASAGSESSSDGHALTRTRSRIERISEQLAESRQAKTSFAVAGETGTGRTTLLTDLMDGHDPVGFDALDTVLHSAQHWLHTVTEALEHEHRPVAVENVHLLSPPIAHALYTATTRSRVWFAVSSAPLITLSPEVFRIVDACRTRVELLPLRLRKHEIPALAEQYLAEAHASIRFTPAAMHALLTYDWPGNLTELRTEVHAAMRLRTAGDVTPRDLGRLQERLASRPLGAIDGAVRTVIETELRRHRGNKVAVAKALSLSRTTLYKRMKAFGIDG